MKRTIIPIVAVVIGILAGVLSWNFLKKEKARIDAELKKNIHQTIVEANASVIDRNTAFGKHTRP